MSEPLPDGIYPHLDDKIYFSQPRIGSTDLTTLCQNPADYWYSSALNPDRPPREVSDEMVFGSGLHALLLEGEDAYNARVAIKPEHYPDPKTGELKPWHGAASFCRQWEEFNSGFLVLSVDADRRIRHMAALIENHPELGPAMRGGMPEVAILWTDESGVKMRAKLDMLLPRYVIDLKTVGGDVRGLTFTQQVLSLVAQRRLDVQRFLYHQARQQMAGLIAAGAVFGASEDEIDWLKRVAAIDDWKWTWLFYRRRDDKRGYAPVVKPIMRSHADATFESGQQKVAVGIQNYLTFMARFGEAVPWAIIEPADEPEDHEFPAWLRNVAAPVTFPELEEAA